MPSSSVLIPDNDRDADNSAIFVITASPTRAAIYEKSVLKKRRSRVQ
jgi:hypothetical protein